MTTFDSPMRIGDPIYGYDNRVLACAGCDALKRGRTPQQWRPDITNWGNPILDSPTTDRKPRPTPPAAPEAPAIAWCATCDNHVDTRRGHPPHHTIITTPDQP